MKDPAGPIPVFLNIRAGRSNASAESLRQHFGESIAVTIIDPGGLHEVVARAAADGAPIIGIAGGDGTMRTAAAALVRTQSALLPIPTGTLNTFARRHGIHDIRTAATALRAAHVSAVAVGTAGDEWFLNTLTFGEYARIVRRREQYRRFVGKWMGAAIATAGVLATLRRTTVRLDVEGEALIRQTPIVWIGLGWGSFPLLHQSHERRSQPVLEVVVLRSTTKWAAAATLLRLARQMLRVRTPLRDPQLEVLHARSLLLERSRPGAAEDVPAALRGGIDATADGELLRTEGAIRVAVLDAALRVVHRPTGIPPRG